MPGTVKPQPVETPKPDDKGVTGETPPAGASLDERVATLEKEQTEWHGQREQLGARMESLSSKQTELEAALSSLTTAPLIPPNSPEATPPVVPPIVEPEQVPPPVEVKAPEVLKPKRGWLK